MSTSDLHPALTPLQMSGMTLKNRAAVAPMSRISATEDGVPTAAMAAYYGAFAKGGFGLIITEGCYPERRYGRGYHRQPGLVGAAGASGDPVSVSDAQARGWRAVVDTVHASGSAIVLQIMHAGALAQCTDDTIAPSAVQPRGEKMAAYGGTGPFPRPRALDNDDIAQVIQSFADTARRAQDVGFDGVEIHGANGYLIDQFITGYSNRRTDRYGGDMAARAAFAREVVQAVKSAVGGDFAVGLRISQGKVNDHDYRWPGGHTDAEALFTALRAAELTYLHIASEGAGWRHSSMLSNGATVDRMARDILGIPVIANGGLHDPALAAEVLERGHADLVALGLGALANPNWPERIAVGQGIAEANFDLLAPGIALEAHGNAYGVP